jgi:hypothetical protein
MQFSFVPFGVYSSHIKWLLMGCLIWLCAAACNKHDHDTASPIIRIETPTTGNIFYFGNSIQLDAIITDDRKLESVQLDVTDAQNNRYLQSQSFFPTENSFQLNYSLTHNDLYLPSGTYYVRITASDGENQQIAFREIQLTEAPRLQERVFILQENGTSTLIDTLQNNNLAPCIDFATGYLFGGIDSRTNQLVACGQSPASLLSNIFPDFQNANTPFPLTTELISAFHHDKANHCFYWGTNAGSLWRTSVNGTQQVATLGNADITAIGSSPTHILVFSEGTSGNYIHAIRNDNGVIETSLPIDWDVVGIVHLNSENQRELLIGNQNGAAHFAWLNLSTSAINEVFNFYDSSPVLSVCEAAGNHFYAQHEAGIGHYINSLNSYTMSSVVTAEKLVFDDLGNTLWAVTSEGAIRLDENAQSILQTIAAPGIQDVWIKYNK